MKIAISAALVLGLAQYGAAFPCMWNGGGSSYVYDYTYECEPRSGGGVGCITCLDNIQAQSTCCRCATNNDCDRQREIYDPYFDPNDNVEYWSHGCDLAAPQISIGDSAGGAALPAQWFTSTQQLERYLQSTVTCTDDCVDQPSCNIGVSYVDGNGDDRCGNTLVTVTSSDWIGCHNQNTATKSFLVRYDAEAPVVTVNLGEFAYKPLPKEKLEQVPLTVGITDNCDFNPEVTITVFSDEVGLNSDKVPGALLARRYSNNTAGGVQAGWDLWLDRKRYAQKLCEKDFACQVPDGRYYVVRVCAKDQAGWVTCSEDSVGVPLKPTLDKKIDPINEGKLFIVAEDTLFWREQPNEYAYRARNTDLDAPLLAQNPGRLCYANRALAYGNAISHHGIPAWQGSSYRCGELCATTNGCEGYTYTFTNIYNGEGTCTLYDLYDGADGFTDAYAVWYTTTNTNIYVLDGVACPGLEAQPIV